LIEEGGEMENSIQNDQIIDPEEDVFEIDIIQTSPSLMEDNCIIVKREPNDTDLERIQY
jgi:hypothetical protein